MNRDPEDWEPKSTIIQIFRSLRESGMPLGIGDLLGATDALGGGWEDATPFGIKRLLRLLWCRSLLEAEELEVVWSRILQTPPELLNGERQDKTFADTGNAPAHREEPGPMPEPEAFASSASEAPLPLAPLPVRVPPRAALLQEREELNAYWPISRRNLHYAWRYLRRMAADGPESVLDPAATVEQTGKQSFYLQPVYRREERNLARLLLLVDQAGSMMPFHHFTREVVETALTESGLAEEAVEVFYFHNVVSEEVYADAHLTQRVALETALARCDGDTSLLIVSDAGAARGELRRERVRATAQFLHLLRRHTARIAWLNPMPKARWEDTTAAVLAHLVEMRAMDQDGFSKAIDWVRG